MPTVFTLKVLRKINVRGGKLINKPEVSRICRWHVLDHIVNSLLILFSVDRHNNLAQLSGNSVFFTLSLACIFYLIQQVLLVCSIEQAEGNFNFSSSGHQKNYATNIYESVLTNNFSFDSHQRVWSTGIGTNYNFAIKNNNKYKDDPSNDTIDYDYTTADFFQTLIFNSSLPLVKENENSTHYLRPMFQARYSPNDSKDISGNGTELNYNSAFAFNRIGTGDTQEAKGSISLGIEFDRLNINDKKVFSFKAANVLRDKKNPKLPTRSKLDQTRTDIVGQIEINPNDFFELKHQFSYDRDLDHSNYDFIETELEVNNFITKFNYFTQNHEGGNAESIYNGTTYKFNKDSKIMFSTNRDLINDFTEYYNLIYQYETDCMSASFNYNRKFYRDGSLVPTDTLFFVIRFIPFVEVLGSANQTLEQLNK